jgi:large subunit ribosomal protein L24
LTKNKKLSSLTTINLIMSIAKIQSGDTVKVIAGNFKGTVGVVTKVIHKIYPKGKNKSITKTRASVDAIKKITKYRKSTVYQGQKYAGNMSQVDRFVDISNLALLDESGKPSRVKIVEVNGKKTRTFQTTSGTITKKILPKVAKSENLVAETEALKLENA